jgi:prepilin-type N-terminal cleavage/methylation domain-containing protein
MARTKQHCLSGIKAFKDERGLTLVESLVTIAIVGVVLTTFAVALSTGSMAVSESDQQVTVQSLARNQMEYTKGYPYNPAATTYPTVNTVENYSISVAVAQVEVNLQKVTASISKEGQVLLSVDDYKVNR